MSEGAFMSADRVIELLQGIWGEMKSLNGRIDTTNENLGTLAQAFERGLGEIKLEMSSLNRRVASLDEHVASLDERFERFVTGEHGRSHRDLQRRLARLEHHCELEPLGER